MKGELLGNGLSVTLVTLLQFYAQIHCPQGNALVMEAVSTSETSVYFHDTTQRYIPESFHLHTLSRENLASVIAI
jgi:hypothetical protein